MVRGFFYCVHSTRVRERVVFTLWFHLLFFVLDAPCRRKMLPQQLDQLFSAPVVRLENVQTRESTQIGSLPYGNAKSNQYWDELDVDRIVTERTYLFCVYKNPLPHVQLAALRMSLDPAVRNFFEGELSREELEEQLPNLVNLPVMLEHLCNDASDPPTFSGEPRYPLGRVVEAKQDSVTGSVFAYVQFYDTDDGKTGCMETEIGHTRGCSLHHFINLTLHKIVLRELSICFQGKRPGTLLHTILIGYPRSKLVAEPPKEPYRHPPSIHSSDFKIHAYSAIFPRTRPEKIALDSTLFHPSSFSLSTVEQLETRAMSAVTDLGSQKRKADVLESGTDGLSVAASASTLVNPIIASSNPVPPSSAPVLASAPALAPAAAPLLDKQGKAEGDLAAHAAAAAAILTTPLDAAATSSQPDNAVAKEASELALKMSKLLYSGFKQDNAADMELATQQLKSLFSDHVVARAASQQISQLNKRVEDAEARLKEFKSGGRRQQLDTMTDAYSKLFSAMWKTFNTGAGRSVQASATAGGPAFDDQAVEKVTQRVKTRLLSETEPPMLAEEFLAAWDPLTKAMTESSLVVAASAQRNQSVMYEQAALAAATMPAQRQLSAAAAPASPDTAFLEFQRKLLQHTSQLSAPGLSSGRVSAASASHNVLPLMTPTPSPAAPSQKPVMDDGMREFLARASKIAPEDRAIYNTMIATARK